MMMSSQNSMQHPCPYKDLHKSTRWTIRLQSNHLARKQATGQVSCRAEGDTPKSQAMDTRQEATTEAKDHLITDVNKVNVAKEATAIVFPAPLLEGEPEV